jgi:transcriptional repressor OPI1
VATSHLGSSISTLQSLLLRAQRPFDEENHAINRTSIGIRIEKIKQDIVDTLRKAVDVVSRHAGSALPEPARHRVKLYILSLPARWAAASSPSQASPNGVDCAAANGLTREEETGWKVLTLASESLQMLSGVMNVVGDTLQSAEEWAGRLGRNKRSPGAAPGVSTPESIHEEKEKEKEDGHEMNVDGNGC